MNNHNPQNIPVLTLQNYRISVNAICIKSLPEYDFVQIRMNPSEKKLALRPCKEEIQNTLRWCSATAKRSPRKITCRILYIKIMLLMDWRPDNCYKLFGNFICSDEEPVFVFDLNAPRICKSKSAHFTPTIQTDTTNGFMIFYQKQNPSKEPRKDFYET